MYFMVLAKDKKKVKLSLVLIKHRGGIAPLFLDLGTRWRSALTYTLRMICPRETAPGTHWIVVWVGPRAGLDAEAGR
jgi:hypothetical protein